jgi:HEAT repeat protein
MALAGRIVRFRVGSRRIGAARPAASGRTVALVATAIGAGCLMPSYAHAADESSAVASGLAVTVLDGRLSVRLDEAPLEAVLEAIAAQADVRIMLHGDPGAVRPQAFADLPLDTGIRRLAGERRLMMVFRPSGDRDEPGRLQEVWVYGDPRSGDPSSRLLTRTLGNAAKAPTPPSPERTPAAPALPSYQELSTRDKAGRLAAIRALARQQDEATIEVLSALLAHDPDDTVRRIAATALGNIGGESAVPAFEVALTDRDVEVRVQAMRSLHIIRGEAAAASIGEVALGDADPGLRRQAISLLATLRSDEARSTVELAASDPDDSVRQAAEEALTHPRRGR